MLPRPAKVVLQGADAGVAKRSRQLFALLASLIRGRGYLVLQQTERGNGYEGLRQLLALYTPQSQGRALGILTAITQVPTELPSV